MLLVMCVCVCACVFTEWMMWQYKILSINSDSFVSSSFSVNFMLDSVIIDEKFLLIKT